MNYRMATIVKAKYLVNGDLLSSRYFLEPKPICFGFMRSKYCSAMR